MAQEADGSWSACCYHNYFHNICTTISTESMAVRENCGWENQWSIKFRNHRGAILGSSWGHLGVILGHLVPSCAILAHLGAILGPSRPILGPFWGNLGASKPQSHKPSTESGLDAYISSRITTGIHVGLIIKWTITVLMSHSQFHCIEVHTNTCIP